MDGRHGSFPASPPAIPSGSLLLALLELVLFLVGIPLAAVWLGGITATVLFCVYALFLLVSLITISVNAFRAAAS